MNRTTKFVLFSIVGPVLFGLFAYSVLRSASNIALRQLSEANQTRPSASTTGASAPQGDVARQAANAQRMQLEARAAQMRADAEAARLEQQETARKEAAWQTFFKPKKVCDNPPDSDTQVECGNAYMRAKREFDERWERGELR